MKLKNKKILLLNGILIILIMNFFMLNLDINPDLNFNEENKNNIKIDMPVDKLHDQGTVQDFYTEEWLDNGDFSSGVAPWYNETIGDDTDVNASVSAGAGNFEVLGDQRTMAIDNPLSPTDWTKYKDPFHTLPQMSDINESGAHVFHIWDENVDQTLNTPMVQWKRNITMPVNMSDYIITSASLEAVFNATVTVSPHNTGGIDRQGDSGLDAYTSGDYATFYVFISDIDETFQYRIAYNQTDELGSDAGAGTPSVYDTFMKTLPETVLIGLLTSLLATDGYNFTLGFGIDIYCEDNEGGIDVDRWNSLIIKSVNLTFTYEKKIDQLTSLSWNQIGNKLPTGNVDVENATLNFRYKVDQTWPSASPNAEFRMIINDTQHPETVKLSSATTSWQDAKTGGFDVANLINTEFNISLSIQVFLADEFGLDQKLTISIDNVSLEITYSVITTEDVTSFNLFLNDDNKTLPKFIEISIGEPLNITFKYKNSTNGFIDGATVKLYGVGNPQNLTENPTYEQYNITVNTNLLKLGENYLTIKAEKKYYETQEIYITVDLEKRSAFIDNVFLNQTETDTIEIPWNELLNINITFNDTLTNASISGGDVKISKIGYERNLTEAGQQYGVTINTTKLDFGINFLTISAEAENHSLTQKVITVNVIQRKTNIEVYVNGKDSKNFNYFNTTIGEFLNITAFYNDNKTGKFIENATVEALGESISDPLKRHPTYDQYNITIAAIDLGMGIKFLTISGQKGNHSIASKLITIRVSERKTELQLWLNDVNHTDDKYIKIEVNKMLNITVTYRDANTSAHIDKANITLINEGDLDEHPIYEQYNITVDVSTLGQGINFLTLYAQKPNYEPKSMLITIEVTEQETKLFVYLNKTPYNASLGETYEVTIGDTINITVIYETLSGTFIDGAEVKLTGELTDENLTKNAFYNQYNATIDSNTLNRGINILTLYAYKVNYKQRTVQIRIKINDKPTDIHIFVNTVNVTSDLYYEIPIGSALNITVYYFDNTTKLNITGADIYLYFGAKKLGNFTKNGRFYTFLLSATESKAELDIGLRILTIEATANNYQSITPNIRINVKRIRCEVTTESGEEVINKEPGDSVTIKIVINNLDFPGRIKGATVTFTSNIIGQTEGELKDSDGDGVYEVIIENLPEGTYKVIISVTFEDEDDLKIYEVQQFEITISVIRPPEEAMLFLVLMIVFIGVAIVLGGYLIAYQKVLKYPKPVRKVRGYRKTLKKSKAPSVEIISREKSFRDLFEIELGKEAKHLRGAPVIRKPVTGKAIDKVPKKTPDKVPDKAQK